MLSYWSSIEGSLELNHIGAYFCFKSFIYIIYYFFLTTRFFSEQTRNMNPDDYEWAALTESERISIAGRCPRKGCKKANRIEAKFCREHRFSKNLKCNHHDCHKYRISLSKFCGKHSKQLTVKRILKCERCGNPRSTSKHRMCALCVRTNLKCRFCKKNPAVKWRGHVCSTCPLPYELKCKEYGCQHRMLSKKLGVCSNHK